MEYTNFRIVNTHGLKARSYISFYWNGKRIREYNGNNLCLPIHPNRATSAKEKSRLLKRLLVELIKAIKAENYPVVQGFAIERSKNTQQVTSTLHPTRELLDQALQRKLTANLSYYYKKNLKGVHLYFTSFLTKQELKDDIRQLKQQRIQEFLDQFSSSGANYMNRRRELGVLFANINMTTGLKLDYLKATPPMKRKAKLHKIYEREQLLNIFSYLQIINPNLHLCCLICYGCFLRPHQEIRNLRVSHLKKDCTEIHLSGEENKSGRIRIVYIPEFVRQVLLERTKGLEDWQNIFNRTNGAYNPSYFHTHWQRLKPEMYRLNLLQPLQTLYSFRHSAAVNVYRKTKDLDIVKKLMGHSDMIVTLKYLRSLGEYNDDSLKAYMPDL